ncbi:hypothetical protein [Cohnella panacarvi]|uniref:hypothetical protein n=1 Tax=Cohnella panacarvi TaxID=400776 RepID=UPI00047A0A8F|nr:hypothetical protein [Cohnella panacarvi]
MKAIILSGSYIIGYHESPDIEDFEALGAQYELVEEIPEIILNTPRGMRVVRSESGTYELEDILQPASTPEQEITQLKMDNLSLKLALAELAAIITGGAD